MAELMIAYTITTGVFIAFGVLLFALRGKGHSVVATGPE
jgi:hypothetical protein